MENSPDFDSIVKSKSSDITKKYLLLLILLTFLIFLALFAFYIHKTKNIILSEHKVGDLKAAEKFIDNTRVFSFEEKEAVKKGFLAQAWPAAKTDFQKFNAYYRIYSSLSAKYNITKDESLVKQMDNIESFLSKSYPDIYKATIGGGGFSKANRKNE